MNICRYTYMYCLSIYLFLSSHFILPYIFSALIHLVFQIHHLSFPSFIYLLLHISFQFLNSAFFLQLFLHFFVSIYVFLYLSFYWFIYLVVQLSICLLICYSERTHSTFSFFSWNYVYNKICLWIYLPTYLSVFQNIYPSF